MFISAKGGGPFSDGKLTTRTKSEHIESVKRTLVEMGAPPNILIEAKPHVGTDRLRVVVTNIRKRLADLGCEVRFGTRMTDIIIQKGKIGGIVVNGGEEIKTDRLVLAIGQSCTLTYKMLHDKGVALAPKGFAMGLRVEHPQALIDEIQYGKWRGHKELPPAEYVLTARLEDMNRSVYTFCMCPGGEVIGCELGNGGSRDQRDEPLSEEWIFRQQRCCGQYPYG